MHKYSPEQCFEIQWAPSALHLWQTCELHNLGLSLSEYDKISHYIPSPEKWLGASACRALHPLCCQADADQAVITKCGKYP
jgi:hypothetical protein